MIWTQFLESREWWLHQKVKAPVSGVVMELIHLPQMNEQDLLIVLAPRLAMVLPILKLLILRDVPPCRMQP